MPKSPAKRLKNANNNNNNYNIIYIYIETIYLYLSLYLSLLASIYLALCNVLRNSKNISKNAKDYLTDLHSVRVLWGKRHLDRLLALKVLDTPHTCHYNDIHIVIPLTDNLNHMEYEDTL